jgi:hypothetical protein
MTAETLGRQPSGDARAAARIAREVALERGTVPVVPACEFGERQFELAANLELLAGSGRFFAPTTPAEAHLAIDVALTPGDPRIWSLLGVPPPTGVVAGAGAFRRWPVGGPAAASPPFLVSLFIQYKRSTHLTRATANEWGTHQVPYWRVDLTPRQHCVLKELEVAVGADAVVRYAAPKFWKHREMWQYQGIGAVLDNSLLVAPSYLDRQHVRLTWSRARGLVGHSEPEPLRAETSEGLGREIIERVRAQRREPTRVTPRRHLESLANAVAELTPSQRRREQWQDEIAARAEVWELPASGELVEPLADMATVAEAAHTARASWLMVAVAELDSYQAGIPV